MFNHLNRDAEWTSIKTNCDFDYIVIGSGFCALAFIHEIIQQDPNATVLCLERGGETDNGVYKVEHPGR